MLGVALTVARGFSVCALFAMYRAGTHRVTCIKDINTCINNLKKIVNKERRNKKDPERTFAILNQSAWRMTFSEITAILL